ncbi:MAG: hypothetical protein MPJ78_05500 [Hyphomicrobiaceae bacterium]|nr:hypothetical protein [Hyphomicrobiaceae bacterium]
MRVLHAPTNVGNQPWSLSRAERRLGLESDLVVNYQTWFGFPADRVLGSLNGRSATELATRTFFGLTAPFRYDVLHYYFGRSLLYWDDLPNLNRLPFADLKLARRLGKKIFMTLQGCDARLAGISNKSNKFTPCSKGMCGAFETCISYLDAQREELIKTILPNCSRVFYLNPELGNYVPHGTFIPYANVDIDAIAPAKAGHRKTPIVVHAPSDPGIKGTALILEALKEIKSRHPHKLKLVQGMSHEDAMQIYRSADIVIDQVLAGWYGGLAVEVMAMGKPVACTIREADLQFIPPAMRDELPILTLRPNRLADDLAEIFESRNQWSSIGLKSRKFVERWHHPDKIASAIIKLYQNPESSLEITSEE